MAATSKGGCLFTALLVTDGFRVFTIPHRLVRTAASERHHSEPVWTELEGSAPAGKGVDHPTWLQFSNGSATNQSFYC